ncbi:hypothetical protein MCHIJ_12890 [Mycolicibacterium chitae]|uniref:Ferredoxin n=1 Tax=Mycolicibacterium chitae TaxID=1792 RepID=A0A3S4RL73_MYCCI|nr:hypothetical protein [Mycolicibacterium chitae]MCV7107752.1 hypothetical protein [Mycolicibacterium chitae]BBZ01852.1 hypothetical protein MCHIJ_12890 [Mycolicibacterium chitae]VEG50681.1 Uncharacterised protein [Mycolicibacterium chitae]
MTVRPDVRLADAPMRPVGCGSCGAQVLVRKSSWEQTSVQWNRDAMLTCVERRRGRGQFTLCANLRSSIEAAVRDGELAIVDDPS